MYSKTLNPTLALPAIDKADIRSLSLVSEFQEFCWELIRLRGLAEAVTGPVTEPASSNSPDAQPVYISARLTSLMERRALYAGRSAGEVGFNLYREVQYVMAALSDEVFLRLDWPGQAYWISHLLETQLFDSHNAGEEFFTRLDRLLDQPERSYTDIYVVYLMALSLGFRGKYAGKDDGGRMEGYRRRLFVRIYRRRPELFAGQTRLFPDSYRYTLSEGIARKLPSPNRWFAALVAAILIWLGAAHLAWHDVMDDLAANISRIQNTQVSASK